MTGSHEVRGSIPLGSTNSINSLGPLVRWPFPIFCAYSVPTPKLAADSAVENTIKLVGCRLLHGRVKRESRYHALNNVNGVLNRLIPQRGKVAIILSPAISRHARDASSLRGVENGTLLS